MKRLVGGCVLAAAVMSAAPLWAQQAPAASEPEQIVVTGRRDAERQIRGFVNALTPSRVGGQLARFETAFCPSVWGLTPAQNQAVARRLRAVAAAAEIEVGGDSCRPNAMVILVDDKRSFIEGLARSRPASFGQLSLPQISRLARSAGPTAAWQLEGMVDAGGMPIASDGSGPAINRTTEMASLITAAARPVFEAAAVVIEKSALAGLTTTQLADYAAMRLLARTDPSRIERAAPTILSVIDAPMGSEVPITLTQWDLSFLRGLYASPANLRVQGQRSAIARTVREDMQRAGQRQE